MALNIEWKKCEYGWIECEFSDPQKPFKTTNLSANQTRTNPQNTQNSQNTNDLQSPQNSTNLQNSPSPQAPQHSTIPNTFTLEISALYCPFNEWFFALENIDRHAPPSIYIDCEGFYVQICLCEPRDNRRFKIINLENGVTLFECETNAQEIVQQMYSKLVAFAHSELYEPKHYERVEDEDGWSGFRLSKYRNPTLEHYAEFGLKIQSILYDSKGNQLTKTAYPPAANALKSMGSSAIFHFAYQHSECRFCQSEIRVKTIYDMLAKAYDAISGNEKICEFLRKIGESKESVGICQNASRLGDLPFGGGWGFESPRLWEFKKKFETYGALSPYRVAQATESGVYLCFSEDFEWISCIKILGNFFGYKYKNTLETPLRHRRTKHDLKSDKERLEFLCEIFGVFVPFSQGLKWCLGVENSRKSDKDKIDKNLKILSEKGFFVNKNISEQGTLNAHFNAKDFKKIYDENCEFFRQKDVNFNVSWEENGGFEFLLNDDKKSAKCVSLWLRGWLDDDKKDKTNKNTNLNDETDESQEPLPPRSLWLNQRVISMWPDWGAAFLWSESGGCIDSYIEGYEYLADSWLKDEGYEWACKYMGHESTGFDWQGFNDKGRELWRTLQEKIASKYIVLYGHGWGESEGSFGERDELNGRKKREFELKIEAKNGGTGILNIKDGENYGKSVSYEALNLPRALKKGFEKWQKDYEKNGEKWQNALNFCASEAEKSSLFYYGDEFVSHKKVVDLKDLNGEILGLGEDLKDGENELILDEILSEKSCVKNDKLHLNKAKDGESRRFVCNENGEFMDYDEFIALMNEKKAFDTQGLVLAAKLKDFLKDKAYIEFAELVMHEKG